MISGKMASRLLLFHSKSLTAAARRSVVSSSCSWTGPTPATRPLATTTISSVMSPVSSSSSSTEDLRNHQDIIFSLPSCGSFIPVSTNFRSSFQQTAIRSYSVTVATTAEAAAAAAAAATSEVQSSSLSSDTESTSTNTSTPSPPIRTKKETTQNIIPTRHSIHLPVDVCTDRVELEEMTKSLLRSGEYQYNDDMKALDRYRQKILYVVRGHSSNIPGTLYADTSTIDASPESVASSVSSIMDILINIEEQDQTHRELFYRKHRSTTTAATVNHEDIDDEDEEIEIGSSTFGEVDDMFSSIVEHKHQHEQELDNLENDADFSAIENAMSKLGQDGDDDDFSSETISERTSNADEDNGIMTVMTVAMYETLLDVLAGASQVLVDESRNNNNVDILEQNDVLNPSSILEMVELMIEKARSDDPVTIVTYNAALRSIANLGRFYHQKHGGHSSTPFQQYRDEVLHAGLSVYNLLTHDPFGVKRNGQSVKYLLQSLEQTIPPSRVRGNISVTLWHQASREGVVTPSLVECFLHDIHGVSSKSIDDMSLDSVNGPEFTAFNEKLLATLAPRSSISSSDSSFDETYRISPPRFARFAKKYAHSNPARLY